MQFYRLINKLDIDVKRIECTSIHSCFFVEYIVCIVYFLYVVLYNMGKNELNWIEKEKAFACILYQWLIKSL